MLLSYRTRMACLFAAACAIVLVCFRGPDAPSFPPELDPAAMRRLSQFGEGLLVWERRTAGEWQIWSRSLDSRGKEERLVPAEEGRDHFCPKFSPDGKRLAYMSYRRGETPYDPAVGQLWMLDMASRKQVLLAAKARSYYEDRAVLWFDNQRLCHVDERGHAVELDIVTGARTKLTQTPHKKHGWLVNVQKTHVTSGDPEFALLEKDGAVLPQLRHGGCQPYFSSDGRWGFWMGGAGGPVNKMFLTTRAVGQILDLNDASMPHDRNYLYFPMVSHCQTLMAFGASSDDHDHFNSDYDIFVVRLDAGTLEPIGKPVRYTAFEGNDRFPDVYCQPLPLGRHYVEGTSRVKLSAPEGLTCHWRVDGVPAGKGPTLEQEFSAEGDHWVSARTADAVEHLGLVHVRAGVAPMLTLTQKVEGQGRSLRLTFDEEVSLNDAHAVTEDGVRLPWGEQTAEGCQVLLPLPSMIKPGMTLSISGVKDRAQQANVMPDTRIRVPGDRWPQSRDALVVAWENSLAAPASDALQTPLQSGKAFWNARGGMDMRGGTFDLPKVGGKMLSECGRSGAFTIEAMVTPMVPPYDRETRPVLSLEDDKGNVKLAILQCRSDWNLWLATTDNPDGTAIEQPLMPIRTGQPHHFVLGYEAGHFRLFVNGCEMWMRSQLKGGLAWDAVGGRLRFGACSKLKHGWQGMVEQLSLHSRLLSASEAVALADHAEPKLRAQRTVKTKKVVARLLQTSRVPSLKEIRPYREALVEHIYEVLPKDKGDDEQSFPVGGRIAVAHWVWVNGEVAACPPAKPGETFRLFVEPREAHREISSLVVRSDSPELTATPLLDVSNW